MKKNNLTIFVLILSIGMAACSSTAATTTDNSKTGLDWAGVYAGLIPAADGEGINVQITLRSDESYTISYNYVDKPGVFTESGTFGWDNAGNIITLKNTTFPPYYKVSENQLLQLDAKGKVIKSKFADQYILKKKS